MMAGTAPLIASSGMSSRHRLNRGGNRKLNFALHYMALVRYRSDEKTKAYVERRRGRGQDVQGSHALFEATPVQRRVPADGLRLEGHAERLTDIEGRHPPLRSDGSDGVNLWGDGVNSSSVLSARERQ
jgi:hypothetical protein